MELIPFAEAVAQDVDAIMAAHILMSAIDPVFPASLSQSVITGLLRKEMGFDGVVVTDDLTMGAITEHYGIGEAAVLAIGAGCDLLLVCLGYENAGSALDALTAAVENGTISSERLDESVRRILTLKLKYALTDKPAATADLDTLNRTAEKLFG